MLNVVMLSVVMPNILKGCRIAYMNDTEANTLILYTMSFTLLS